jgi:hypothetical protein
MDSLSIFEEMPPGTVRTVDDEYEEGGVDGRAPVVEELQVACRGWGGHMAAVKVTSKIAPGLKGRRVHASHKASHPGATGQERDPSPLTERLTGSVNDRLAQRGV